MTAIALFPLSPRQEEVLAYMWAFFQENDQLPSRHVIAARFEWKSDNAAGDVLAALRKKGFIEKNTVGKYRFTPLFHAERKREEEAACQSQ